MMTDKDFSDPRNDDDEDFAKLLEESLENVGQQLEPGQKIDARILQIGPEWTFLDVGQKGEGVLATSELQDAAGQVACAAGDWLAVYFLSRRGGELRFTTRIGGGSAGTEQLESAFHSGIPVDGRVEKEIKGGFEIRLAGQVRAFCPYSQSGQRQGEAADLIGELVSFKITQFSEGGRNIVVSRRALLEEERARQREQWRKILKEGQVVRGTVTHLRDFGAFLDIGGLEGLLPISEISYGRIENIHEVLSPGQELDVAVQRLDWENNKFSFSLRQTLADPWSKVGTVYRAGEQYPGTVSRLAPFGAFVSLEEGVDGLLHISKLGDGRRLRHPEEAVKVGQHIRVTIESIDSEARRIALTPAGDEAPEDTSYRDTGEAAGLGTLGDLLKAGLQNKTRDKH